MFSLLLKELNLWISFTVNVKTLFCSISRLVQFIQIVLLNQTFNATQKWFDFYMFMWCRTISLRYIAQLLINNLRHIVNSVSTAQLAELKSDWTKWLIGSQMHAQVSKKQTFQYSPLKMLVRSDKAYRLKHLFFSFTKFNVKFQYIVI